MIKFNALWDTGATNSVITKNVVDALGLKAMGAITAYHANGEYSAETYMVNILLPNEVFVPALKVTEGKLNECDVLIGMDIISQGDFSVCHNGGHTVFTFQLPSTHCWDYVEEVNAANAAVVEPLRAEPKIGRNNLCPCGSGKKYKHCHGKK